VRRSLTCVARLPVTLGIFVQYAVFCLDVLYKLEPGRNEPWIAAKNSLAIVLSSQLRFKLGFATNEAPDQYFANVPFTTCCKQLVGHAFLHK
jgi:hypothetical protein